MTTSNTPGPDAFAKIIARAWADDAFKQRLTAEPRAVLTEAGVAVPEDLEVRVVENTDRVAYLVIPPAPAEGEISEEALRAVSGGTGSAGGVGGCITL